MWAVFDLTVCLKLCTPTQSQLHCITCHERKYNPLPVVLVASGYLHIMSCV